MPSSLKTVELRSRKGFIKAQWVKLELQKVETLFGGTNQSDVYTEIVGSTSHMVAGSGRMGRDHKGQSAVKSCCPAVSPTVKQSTGDGLQKDLPFRLPLPESLPPSFKFKDRAEVEYRISVTLLIRARSGFFRREVASEVTSFIMLAVEKHELHPAWPLFVLPERKTQTLDGYTLTIDRDRRAYGPSDHIAVRAVVRSDTLQVNQAAHYELSLQAHVVYKANGSQKEANSSSVPLEDAKIVITRTKIRLRDVASSLSFDPQATEEITMKIPSWYKPLTISSLKDFEIRFVVQARATLASGKQLCLDLPTIMSNRTRSNDIVRRIGSAGALSAPEVVQSSGPNIAGLPSLESSLREIGASSPSQTSWLQGGQPGTHSPLHSEVLSADFGPSTATNRDPENPIDTSLSQQPPPAYAKRSEEPSSGVAQPEGTGTDPFYLCHWDAQSTRNPDGFVTRDADLRPPVINAPGFLDNQIDGHGGLEAVSLQETISQSVSSLNANGDQDHTTESGPAFSVPTVPSVQGVDDPSLPPQMPASTRWLTAEEEKARINAYHEAARIATAANQQYLGPNGATSLYGSPAPALSYESFRPLQHLPPSDDRGRQSDINTNLFSPQTGIPSSTTADRLAGVQSGNSLTELSTLADTITLIDDIGLAITWISPIPLKINGHFCDLFQGMHSRVGRIALKRPRIGGTGYDDVIIREGVSDSNEKPQPGGGSVIRTFLSSLGPSNVTVTSILSESHQTADALQYLHKEEIVHGDIKAGNILINDGGKCLLCDFGLTKEAESRTSTSMRGAGTFRWQSPELWNNAAKTYESDVYAFAMTIVEVLTGEAPFLDLTNDMAVMYAVMLRDERPPRRPMASSNGISYESIWEVAAACWRKEPGDRIAMTEALAKIQADPSLQVVKDIAPRP
ncbi:hypothetical protein FRB90_002744 [Tulasnella sp. 427]|nr:hypothetical protein FRB90_002744 [Tulasnella sp. 427]